MTGVLLPQLAICFWCADRVIPEFRDMSVPLTRGEHRFNPILIIVAPTLIPVCLSSLRRTRVIGSPGAGK